MATPKQGLFVRAVLSKRLIILLLALVLLAMGGSAYRNLSIDAYPGVAPLNVQVITQWPGRSATEVEKQLTVPIETAMFGVPEVESVRSVSLFGLSVVTVTFNDGADGFKARQNVQMNLSNATLPTGLQPSLSPDATATGEIMRYRIEGGHIDLMTLKSLQDWTVYKQIKSVPGVADVSAFGGLVKQYQILPDPAKMQALNISLNQMVTAITNANANVGGGLMRGGEQQYVVRGVGLLQTPADIGNVVVAVNQGVPVRIRDLAQVVIGNSPRLGVVQYNHQSDVVEGIVLLRRGEDASKVLVRVRDKIANLNSSGQLPAGVKLVPFYDRQNLLDITTDTVKHTLIVGMTLVLAVLFLFLGNIRAALIVASAIPLALCVSFIGMTWLNVPANLISLGAIDFGVIVDAAVIVLENIMRQLEQRGVASETSTDAIITDATSEVQRAMMFSTGIIIVAYAPLFLIGGVEGVIFKPMAFTMGFALLASIALALTYIPALTSYVFRRGAPPHSPKFIGWLLNGYRPLLRKLLRWPALVVGVALVVLAMTGVVASRLGTEFLPTLEENNLWLRIDLPVTADLDYSRHVADGLREYFAVQPEVSRVVVQIGRPDDGTDSTGVFNQEYGIYLKPPAQWPKGETKDQLVSRLQTHLERIPGIDYNFSQYIQDNVEEALSGVKGQNSVKLVGDDLQVLENRAMAIERVLKSIPGMADVGIFRELGQPTLNVTVNREACARFGLNVSDVENLVQYSLGGNTITNVLEGEQVYGLVIRFPEASRDTLEKIQRLLVDTPDGNRIPLSMVADVQLTGGPFFIYREAGKRYIAIKFSVRGRDLGSAVAAAQKMVAQQVNLPRGYTIDWAGEFNEMKRAQAKLAVIIPLTLLAIFILLYSTFGKFKDALLVLVNVPFATIGGIAALALAHETLSISAGIGFLSLFGIAIQDGVILIAYVRKIMQEQHEDLKAAVIHGASQRLRPVLMTALLASLGLLPAALSHAIGSQAQRPLALVIVGGMVSTTLLTLLVLPVIYYWANRNQQFAVEERGNR